ncbi:sulfite reductase subunit alpha [Xanthomonas cucurbitae]|uniref:sulfite reductase subunit alpha n=1 Tax=Xanthomonas cucurbitae TaxID=56453 RepID=UPI00132ED9D5|nr:flavodoxin domain-containing protein [Xanthomonas cucurbitae]QHG87671.1 sulfite reductase flavoprotein subunit alpha [Xanthomonas cucurbitae]WDM74288.1 sulfite reductase subunit alpha [Xanthomonas cucurbitae]
MTSPAPRLWLGNGVLLLALAALAGWLGSLHAGTWWSAPAPARWQWAGAAVALYAVLCGVAWAHHRRQHSADADDCGILIVWASQTGFARELAERCATALQGAGVGACALPLEEVDADRLARVPQLLCILSTSGEGDAPDHAQAVERDWLARDSQDLAAVRYAVLALGDRRYTQFCAFGRRIDSWLQARGASALFERIDVDNADPRALQRWQDHLTVLAPALASQATCSVPSVGTWRLRERCHVNPGSAGAPIQRLWLTPHDGPLPQWTAGDIAEIVPQNPPDLVEAWLRRHQLDGARLIDDRALRDWLASARLPADGDVASGEAVASTIDAHALVRNLVPLPHRDYSLASIPQHGHVELLVREHRHADGVLGLGSGWLCTHAPLHAPIALRIRRNPGFHPPTPDRPMVLIGNGTGIAGLRAHLCARLAAGAHDNWLVFGERNAAHDALYADELGQWHRDGHIVRLDLVYSRDRDPALRYVQHALAAAADTLRHWIDRGACLYLCGSLRGMAPEVDRTLDRILGPDVRLQLLRSGRYRRDVY